MYLTKRSKQSPGERFKLALQQESPLQLVGTVNPYCALLAKQAGFKAIYLSGAGIANCQFGLPDLAMTSLTEVAAEVKKITTVCDLPLLVDADTGWGDILNVQRTVIEMELAGAAGIHIEDQNFSKRCGHRDNKKVIETAEMAAKIKAATDARTDASFIIMARCDAVGVEGLDKAIGRMQEYVNAGADMIFAEALYSLDDYLKVTKSINAPVLANITEFGKTPLFTVQELADVGVSLVLYPQSAFRAMSKAALNTYSVIRQQQSQKSILDTMQSRDDLYKVLDYHRFEQELDKF